jgi:hypothetical protein
LFYIHSSTINHIPQHPQHAKDIHAILDYFVSARECRGIGDRPKPGLVSIQTNPLVFNARRQPDLCRITRIALPNLKLVLVARQSFSPLRNAMTRSAMKLSGFPTTL